MDEDKANFGWAWWSIVGGVVLGVFISFLSTKLPSADKADYFVGAISGGVIACLSLQIFQTRDAEKMKVLLDYTNRLAHNAFQLNVTAGGLHRRVGALSKKPEIVRKTALYALDEANNTFDFNKSDSGIHISGRRLSLKSYRNFWQHVVDVQRNFAKRRKLTARMIHSSEVDIFYDVSNRSLNSIHGKFAEKGKIYRILVDTHEPDNSRLSRYQDALKNMRNNDVCCVYVNVSRERFLSSDPSTKEFCIIDQLGLSAEWNIRSNHEVDSFFLTGDVENYQTNLYQWNELVRCVEASNYDGIEQEKADYFRKLKEDFLAAHPS